MIEVYQILISVGQCNYVDYSIYSCIDHFAGMTLIWNTIRLFIFPAVVFTL